MMKKLLSMILCLLIISSFAAPLTAFSAECENGKHEYETLTTPATEEENGETVNTCKHCGFSYRRVLPAIGHTWSDWFVDKQPTCVDSGSEYRACIKHSNDPHEEKRESPALGHAYVGQVEKAPSCNAGGTMKYTCTSCADTYKENYGVATGHTYKTNVTKAATCEKEGENQLTCAGCGDAKKSVIPPLGHEYGQWVVDKEAAEGVEGHKYQTCVNDNSHVIEGIVAALEVNRADAPGVVEAEKQTVIPPIAQNIETEVVHSFPYVADVCLLFIALLAAAGFGILVYPDIYVMKWEKEKAVPYAEWLKSNNSQR